MVSLNQMVNEYLATSDPAHPCDGIQRERFLKLCIRLVKEGERFPYDKFSDSMSFDETDDLEIIFGWIRDAIEATQQE